MVDQGQEWLLYVAINKVFDFMMPFARCTRSSSIRWCSLPAVNDDTACSDDIAPRSSVNTSNAWQQ